jgi:hypothetical protein
MVTLEPCALSNGRSREISGVCWIRLERLPPCLPSGIPYPEVERCRGRERRLGWVGPRPGGAARLVHGLQFPPAPAKAFPAPRRTRFDELVQAAIDVHRLPGVVVSIHDPSRGTFAKAYGTADVRSGRKMQVIVRFRINSVTSSIVTMARTLRGHASIHFATGTDVGRDEDGVGLQLTSRGVQGGGAACSSCDPPLALSLPAERPEGDGGRRPLPALPRLYFLEIFQITPVCGIWTRGASSGILYLVSGSLRPTSRTAP